MKELGIKKPALVSLTTMYAIGLITCFICNLAVSRSLSWFYIVLCSVAIAFSVTCLPMLLKQFRVAVPVLAATASLAGLLFVCSGYGQAGWLKTAYLIVAMPFVLLLGFVFIATRKGVNWYTKSAVMSLLAAVTSVAVNPWVDAVLSGSITNYSSLFLSQFQTSGSGYFVNMIVAVCFVAYFVIGLIMGVVFDLRNRGSRA